MIRSIRINRAIVVAGMLETVRRKDIYVVVILGLLIVGAAWAFNFFGATNLQIFIRDVAFSAVGLLSTILAVMIAARQVPEELRRRTIYLLLAQPITRWQLLTGKWATSFLTASLGFASLTLVVVCSLLAFGVSIPQIFWQYVMLKVIGFGWLCALTVGLSVYMTPAATVTISLLLALGSSLASRMVVLLNADSPVGNAFASTVNAIVPHYDLFDLGSKVTYAWPPVPMWVMLAIFCYAIVGGAFWLFVGWIKFRRQAV
jgi:ABC-type transport system involved in multi-copper enzyme maturation permease subunit